RHARDMSATEVTDVRRIKEPRAIHRDRGRLDLAIARREQRRRTPRGRHFIQMAPTVAFPDERDAVVGRPEKLVAELPGAVVLVERVVDGADPRSRLPDPVRHQVRQCNGPERPWLLRAHWSAVALPATAPVALEPRRVARLPPEHEPRAVRRPDGPAVDIVA